jgi:enoyl-[acyl-carrier protein] reductase I
MGLFSGKKGVIMGVANDHSIAAAVAKKLSDEGAELAFNHLPDKDDRKKMERRVRKVTDELNTKLVLPCDVSSDEDIAKFFSAVKDEMGEIDFLLHSIAYASVDDIRGGVIDVSREGFKLAMDISAYSLIAASREAAKIMRDNGAIVAMTYLGGERVIAGYNLMGVCKAALDASVKYLAFDLGARGIRVNAVSAGPLRTLAASAVGDFSSMLSMYEAISPINRNITAEEVAGSTAYLLSDLSTAVTGEIHHVDCGYHVMGNPGRATEIFKNWKKQKAE